MDNKEKDSSEVLTLSRAFTEIITLKRDLESVTKTLTEVMKTHMQIMGNKGPEPTEATIELDEELNKTVDRDTYTRGIVTNVYKGRVVSIKEYGDKALDFHFSNYILERTDNNFKATRIKLSPESFILIMEAMAVAAKRFGINREDVIKSLTGGEDIIVKDQITVF